MALWQGSTCLPTNSTHKTCISAKDTCRPRWRGCRGEASFWWNGACTLMVEKCNTTSQWRDTRLSTRKLSPLWRACIYLRTHGRRFGQPDRSEQEMRRCWRRSQGSGEEKPLLKIKQLISVTVDFAWSLLFNYVEYEASKLFSEKCQQLCKLECPTKFFCTFKMPKIIVLPPHTMFFIHKGCCFV